MSDKRTEFTPAERFGFTMRIQEIEEKQAAAGKLPLSDVKMSRWRDIYKTLAGLLRVRLGAPAMVAAVNSGRLRDALEEWFGGPCWDDLEDIERHYRFFAERLST